MPNGLDQMMALAADQHHVLVKFARHASASDVQGALDSAPVWPYGLAFLLVAGAGATALAGRRLRTPIRRLPNGTRIA